MIYEQIETDYPFYQREIAGKVIKRCDRCRNISHIGQGYFRAKPLPEKQFLEFCRIFDNTSLSLAEDSIKD